ncbi:hypothetical protein SAMN02800694_0158 [Luteibacter sp. UNCMF331Sha3.1]|nr:hypothetical protein SAMN02800694_0158 [Luteibacter sp. UNCMF331Sha3.1]
MAALLTSEAPGGRSRHEGSPPPMSACRTARCRRRVFCGSGLGRDGCLPRAPTAAKAAPTRARRYSGSYTAACLADWQSRRPPPSARLAEPSAASGSGPQGAGPDGRPFSSRQEPSRKPPLAARARRGVSHRTRPRSGILSQATVKPGAPRAAAYGSSRPRETQRDGASRARAPRPQADGSSRTANRMRWQSRAVKPAQKKTACRSMPFRKYTLKGFRQILAMPSGRLAPTKCLDQ